VTTVHWLASRFFFAKKNTAVVLFVGCAEVGKRAEFAQRLMQIFSKKEKEKRHMHADAHVSLLTNLLCIITITLGGVGDTLQDRRVVP